MNRNYLLCLICIVFVAGCTDVAPTTVVAVPTPTPENYGLYTDDDLQIYADSIDLKIQEALKTNNASQAQELGRKRQELIAEFDRRHLKRHSVPERSSHPHYAHPRPVNRPVNPPVNRPGNGLPGE